METGVRVTEFNPFINGIMASVMGVCIIVIGFIMPFMFTSMSYIGNGPGAQRHWWEIYHINVQVSTIVVSLGIAFVLVGCGLMAYDRVMKSRGKSDGQDQR